MFCEVLRLYQVEFLESTGHTIDLIVQEHADSESSYYHLKRYVT